MDATSPEAVAKLKSDLEVARNSAAVLRDMLDGIDAVRDPGAVNDEVVSQLAEQCAQMRPRVVALVESAEDEELLATALELNDELTYAAERRDALRAAAETDPETRAAIAASAAETEARTTRTQAATTTDPVADLVDLLGDAAVASPAGAGAAALDRRPVLRPVVPPDESRPRPRPHDRVRVAAHESTGANVERAELRGEGRAAARAAARLGEPRRLVGGGDSRRFTRRRRRVLAATPAPAAREGGGRSVRESVRGSVRGERRGELPAGGWFALASERARSLRGWVGVGVGGCGSVRRAAREVTSQSVRGAVPRRRGVREHAPRAHPVFRDDERQPALRPRARRDDAVEGAG